jgi:hypothetical protein
MEFHPLPESSQTKCSNPACAETFDSEKAKIQINNYGLVFADCEQLIVQGYKCPSQSCDGYQLIYSRPDEPAFDMRGYIISPHINHFDQVAEQIVSIENQSGVHDFLKFKFIPAWDEKVPFEKLQNAYRDRVESYCNNTFDYCDSMSSIPYKMSFSEFTNRLDREEKEGIFHLRRLYPDTDKFRSLLRCIAPDKITEIEEFDSETFSVRAEQSSAEEISELVKSLCKLLEFAAGITFREAVLQWLNSKEISDFDEKELNTQHYRIFDYRDEIIDKLRKLSRQINFLDEVDKYLSPLFQRILNPICTEVALSGYRKELTKWVDKVEKGKALFVEAPMGLGKTHSIVEALANNQNLSAIIFMPTIKLCEEIVYSLKAKIAWNSNNYLQIHENIENVLDSQEKDKVDSNGYPIKRFRRAFLENEVFYADGINPDECPFYDIFIERYNLGWFTKNCICINCLKYKKNVAGEISCRFWNYHRRAPLSRIIVATHMHYNSFSKQTDFRKWFKDGYYKTNEKGETIRDENNLPLKADGIDRNFFIIDEDIILSHCYKPKSLKKSQLKPFISTITDFLSDLHYEEDTKVHQAVISSINEILAQFEKCDQTSIVPPINKRLKIRRKIKDLWQKEYSKLDQVLPEFLDENVIVGNHLEFIEHAIKYGFTIQNYEKKTNSNGSQISKRIKKAFLPNPTTMDLSNLPPHVFFDGTKINDEFIKNKLKNIEMKKHEISLKPMWNYRLFQNTNADLPATQISTHKPLVKDLLNRILSEIGPEKKYFIISSKDNRDGYIENFIRTDFPDYKFFIGHYGYIKGINDAKDCTVAILLGSFIPPDAFEIAMGLEFIQDQLKPNKILPTKNNVWSNGDKNFRRKYKKDFLAIEEISSTYRHSEHRQALARTRYLFHDVDFYILSKEPLTTYEPFFSSIETYHFGTDFFFKEKRSDSMYPEIRQKILALLDQNGKMREMDFFEILGNSRTTLREHLGTMVGEDCIVRCGKSYSLPPVKKNEHPNL